MNKKIEDYNDTLTNSKNLSLSKDLSTIMGGISSKKKSIASEGLSESSKIVTLDDIIRSTSSIVNMNQQADLGAEPNYYNDHFCERQGLMAPAQPIKIKKKPVLTKNILSNIKAIKNVTEI